MYSARISFSDPLLQSCLHFIAKVGWGGFSFETLSSSQNIPLSSFTEHFSKPEDILRVFFDEIDQKIAEALEEGSSSSFCENVLESFMVRFEFLSLHRPFVTRLYQDSLKAPCLGVFLLTSISESLEKTLKNLNVPPSWNVIGPLLWIYGHGFYAWLDDSSPDLSKTLFILDQHIRKLEPFFPDVCSS